MGFCERHPKLRKDIKIKRKKAVLDSLAYWTGEVGMMPSLTSFDVTSPSPAHKSSPRTLNHDL